MERIRQEVAAEQERKETIARAWAAYEAKKEKERLEKEKEELRIRWEKPHFLKQKLGMSSWTKIALLQHHFAYLFY